MAGVIRMASRRYPALLPKGCATNETGVLGALIAWAIAGTGMLMLALVFRSLAVRKPDLNAGIFAYAKAGFGDYVGFNAAFGYWPSVFAQAKGTMLITVFVFLGIEGASVDSRYARKRSDIGKATLLGFLSVLSVFVLVTMVSFGAMPHGELARSALIPIWDGFRPRGRPVPRCRRRAHARTRGP